MQGIQQYHSDRAWADLLVVPLTYEQNQANQLCSPNILATVRIRWQVRRKEVG